jgi:hypothetical protein
VIETNQEQLRKYDSELESLYVGSRIVLVNVQNNAKETITIKGDDADMEEGRLALKKGAVVTEMHLSYKAGSHQWQFSIKGESLNISNLKLPETGTVETPEDLEGVVIEKVHLVEKVIALVNTLFSNFVKLRVSNEWSNKCVPRMRKWISS